MLLVFGVIENDIEGCFVKFSVYVLSSIWYSRKTGKSFEDFFPDSGHSSSTRNDETEGLSIRSKVPGFLEVSGIVGEL